MAYQQPALPWAENALEPHISAKTLGFHYGKHHLVDPALTNDLHVSLVFVQLPIELESVHLCVSVRPFAHELLQESYEWESK